MNCRVFLKITLLLVLLTGTESRAQIPNGSTLWLRADAGVDTMNGAIGVWHDQSGFHHDVTQVDTPRRPIPSPNLFNGQQSIRFAGWNYFDGPNIFPGSHDYTISAVVRLSDTTVISNVVSGSSHALWFNSMSYPGVVHGYIPLGATGSVPIRPEGSVLTVMFDAALSTVRIFVDGRMSDSLWIPYNDDSSFYIGAYNAGYCLHGDLGEVVIYDRQLDSSDATSLHHYLLTKFGIPLRPQPPPLDSTFTSIPVQFQFFPRDNHDSATIRIAGTFRRPGFDSIYVETLRNGELVQRKSSPLFYQSGAAPFVLETLLHAELSEYAIKIGIRGSAVPDSVLAYRDSLVCGDAYITTGQSNALFGFSNFLKTNEYCRTFGVTANRNARDTLWSIAFSVWLGYGNDICAWSFALAKQITDSLKIPVCIINGAMAGGTIEEMSRIDANPLDVNSAYGRLLYKVRKAHLDSAVKGLVWDQGEWNTDWQYYDNFKRLRQSFLEDYPSLERIYVAQMRPNDCGNNYDLHGLKELERHLSDSFPDVSTFALTAIPYMNGCHFFDSGYTAWGKDLFKLFARDFYHSTDTLEIRNPNLREAYYSSPSHDEITLEFTPPETQLSFTADTTIKGKLHRMSDFLYLDDSAGFVQSITPQGNKLLLKLSKPNASLITYLPDRFYPDDSTSVYQGPWIVNFRGLGAFIFHHVRIDSERGVGAPREPVAFTVASERNPSNQDFTLTLTGEGPLAIHVYDVLGRSVFSHDGHASDGTQYAVTIPSATLPAGDYFVRVQNSDGEARSLKLSKTP